MIKIEADSLEEAYSKAASELECSVTQLHVEIIQHPTRGIFGLFKKNALIVASCKRPTKEEPYKREREPKPEKEKARAEAVKTEPEEKGPVQLNETILPESFVTGQDEEEATEEERVTAKQRGSEIIDSFFEEEQDLEEIASEVKKEINGLFRTICFDLDEIDVSVYDENTLLVEFSGGDAALLIGKEGYRYKALSYMIFNWINAKYHMQLRLEIAEFLKNQEESISRYLVGVCESIDRDGRAQTKILDGVLVQIALKQLRERYPDKYVAIRSTRDGSKYIVVNGYNDY
jgi:spoIIIJ-associated protein